MKNGKPLLEKIADRALRRAGRLFEKVEAADRRIDSLYIDVYMSYQHRLSIKNGGGLRSGIRRYDEKIAEDVFIEELAIMTSKWRVEIGDQAVKSMNAATLAINVAQWIGTNSQKRDAIDLMQRIRPYLTAYYPRAIQALVDQNRNHDVFIEEKIIKWQKERMFGEGKYNLRSDINKDVLKEMFE